MRLFANEQNFYLEQLSSSSRRNHLWHCSHQLPSSSHNFPINKKHIQKALVSIKNPHKSVNKRRCVNSQKNYELFRVFLGPLCFNIFQRPLGTYPIQYLSLNLSNLDRRSFLSLLFMLSVWM